MIYTVIDPDGNERQIEGPDGASDEEIIAQAKMLFSQPQNQPTTEQTATTEESAPIDWNQVKQNAIPSIKNRAGDMFGAITHPLDTLKGIDDLMMSGMANLFNNEDPETKKSFQQLLSGIGYRYGSIDKAKRTLEKDPAGAVLDASGAAQILGGGLSLIPGLKGLGRAVETAGNLVDPVANTGRALRLGEKAIANTPGLRDLPERMYDKATTFKNPKIRDLALSRGINPARDLQSLMDQKRTLGQSIEDIVNNADPDITFPADTLTEGLYNARKKFMTVPGIDTVNETRKFDKFVADLEETLGLNRPPINSQILGPNGQPLTTNWGTVAAPELSIRDLHDFKKDAWTKLYGKRPAEDVTLSPGAQTAKKHVTDNAVNTLRNVLPDAYQSYSSEYGNLKDLVREIEPMSRSIKRTEENLRNSAERFGAKSVAVGAAAGHPWLGGSGALGAWIGRLINSPTRRADRAISLRNMREYGVENFFTPHSQGVTPLSDLLDEIEKRRQERLRQQLMRP